MNNLSKPLSLLFDLAIPESKFLSSPTSELIKSNNTIFCQEKIKEFCQTNSDILGIIEKHTNNIPFFSLEEIKKFLSEKIGRELTNQFLMEFNELIIFSFFSSSKVLKNLPIPITEDEIIEALEN